MIGGTYWHIKKTSGIQHKFWGFRLRGLPTTLKDDGGGSGGSRINTSLINERN